MEPLIIQLRVFPAGPESGTSILIILNAKGMSRDDMHATADTHGLEVGFVLPAPTGSDCDFEFRFWTSSDELQMSDLATMGAVWLMSTLGMLARDNLRILTKCGQVEALITTTTDKDNTKTDVWVEVSQPTCTVMKRLNKAEVNEILSALGIESNDLEPRLEIQNVGTSRVKTLVPIKSTEKLNSLEPDFPRIRKLCDKIGSTGLYPYAIIDYDLQKYAARHFPRRFGYWEDVVNGVAASALAFALLVRGYIHSADKAVMVKQGSATDVPSEIGVRFRKWGDDVVGFWFGGTAVFEIEPELGTDTETEKESETGETSIEEAKTEKAL